MTIMDVIFGLNPPQLRGSAEYNIIVIIFVAGADCCHLFHQPSVLTFGSRLSYHLYFLMVAERG